MNQQILGGGAIVCSAAVMYGWAQSFPSDVSIDDCAGELIGQVSAWVSQTEKQTQRRCLSAAMIPQLSQIPERLPIPDRSPSNKLPSNMESMYSNVLEQAQELANRDRLAEAITTAGGIPNNSRHHELAQQLQEGWSQELLQRATNHYQRADMPMAISMLSAIPQSSQRYSRANNLRGRWKQQTDLLNQAIAAQEIGDWSSVITALGALEGTDLYHSAPVQNLLQQATQKQFEPDAALLELSAIAASAAGSTTVAMNLPVVNSQPIDPVPQPSNLVIGIDQALEWARPSATPTAPTAPPLPTTPSKAPKQDTISTTHLPIRTEKQLIQ
jgi:hypothetical protein